MNGRILPFMLVLIAIGIFFAYVNPLWTGGIADTKAAIAAADQALDSAKQYTKQQDQLAAARDAIDPANLKLIETFLPDSVDNVGLILDLNALAARSQLALSNIDVLTSTSNASGSSSEAGALPSSSASTVGSVDLSISAIGTFSALQSFLSGIEKSVRILDVRDLSIKGSNTRVYNYQMVLRLYWLR